MEPSNKKPQKEDVSYEFNHHTDLLCNMKLLSEIHLDRLVWFFWNIDVYLGNISSMRSFAF